MSSIAAWKRTEPDPLMASWHLITPEFPPLIGGVSDHARVLAEAAVRHGLDVHVWGPAGSGPLAGVRVHDTLGRFTPADFERTGEELDRCAPPRRIVLQWVPHGYGRRGMNVAFARWIARRARAGDALDVIVHEPFVDFIGGSWMQPARAVVQRYMTRTVLRPAGGVWMSIPGWRPRLLSPWVGLSSTPRVLPIPGTIPVNHDPAAIERLRAKVSGGEVVVGYFGAGGEYAERALRHTVESLGQAGREAAILCIGRGSEAVVARLKASVPGYKGSLSSTGAVRDHVLSQHLQICDVLLQPYQDGVSGRRTTTISALEHGVPVATTFGKLSEPFWRETAAVETAPAAAPRQLAEAVEVLLDPARNAAARLAAARLYDTRFTPAVALEPLFADTCAS
jgi:glycosyltransferase involved in cell wall biosynthesis